MDTKFELAPLGQVVWEDRYALKDDAGNKIENDILDTFKRVAKAIASKEKDPKKWEKKFNEIMAGKFYSPAGRILAHAGTHYSQLLNCFVLPFKDDSLEAIMDTAKNMAIIQKFGGGTGFNYSQLRPSGSFIKGVNGRSCGVIGFINMMSTISEVIEQGGSRRGANLGLLEIGHPDVWEFISYKTEHNWDRLREFIDIKDEAKWAQFKFENNYKLQMYNVSIGVCDEFFTALKNDDNWPFIWKEREWELYNVQFRKMKEGTYVDTLLEVTADSNKTAIWKAKKRIPFPSAKDSFEIVSKRKIKATEIWEKICYNAWADGCPGLINMSTARNMHNMEYAHPLLSTNPCGEQPLPANGSCNLSSLILPSFVKKNNEEKCDDVQCIDWDVLRSTIHTAVRFADNVIDCCEFPISDIQKMAHQERRIGLGTMGVHDLLIALKLSYDDEHGRALAERVLEFIRNEAYKASIELAKEKGSFPAFNKEKFLESGFVKTLPESIRVDIEKYGIRNAALLSQAPTGTIGAMYNSSTGCEPWFSLSFQRNTRLGSYEDGCPAFIDWKKDHAGEQKPAYFKTAPEISYEDHIRMLILFSKYTDSAVSKTVNLAETATVEDVKKAFIFAMENGVKGLTVFREGCKDGVLINKDEKKEILSVAKEIVQELQETKHDDEGDSRVSPKKRGNRAVGATTRIHMQKHNLYVTVNRNKDGDIIEIFATVGESKEPDAHHTSGVEDSWAEALGKMISLALRAGVKPSAVVRNLKNIPSDKPVFHTIGDCESSEPIPSPPHAIARVIEEELKYSYPVQHKTEVQKTGGQCPKCSSSNLKWKSSTCFDCLDCGQSGCGGG
jgi:ribonucleoside-diphosphate reductase alpha chain